MMSVSYTHLDVYKRQEYDDLMPVHYINVSKAYVDKINEKCIAAGDEALDIDLNVMLPSKLNIREQMRCV